MLTSRDLLQPLPSEFQLYVAADTGTFMSAVIAAVEPIYGAYLFLEEFPNYRYVGGEIELLDETLPSWADRLLTAYKKYRPGSDRVRVWVDQNSQFKTALRPYGVACQSNLIKLEVRVETSREYMQAKNPSLVWLAPWLTVLPYELEHAQYPHDVSSIGRYERLKTDDHTLDCFEHICSRRPRRRLLRGKKPESFVERHLREHRVITPQQGDPHLGRL